MNVPGEITLAAAAGGFPPSRETLQAVLETAREAALVVDASMRVSTSNRAALDAFARVDRQLSGKRLSEVFRNAALHEAFQNALRTSSASDLKIDVIDDDRRFFDVRVSPVEIDGARFAIGVFYDLTQIERLERVRQEFLSNISHELRTPLTSIMAFVETLEDGAIDDRENNRRFLGVIRRNAERMHALIDDILELSQIEAGDVTVEPRSVELTRLVQEIYAGLSAKAAASELELINAVRPDDRVYADPSRLDQILTNLIDNAIKFNRPGGTVTVEIAHTPELAAITVTDTGEGIPAEHLPRIFERFYRADRGRTREIGGTGLGLAIVKHLARLHGGEVSVRSELGSGSAFVVELPTE